MSTFLIHFGPVLAVSLSIPLVFVGAFVGIGRMRRQGQRPATQPMQVQQMAALHDLGDLQKSFDQQDMRAIFTVIGLICAPVGFFLLLSPWTPDITDLLVHAWGMIWILICLLPAIVSLTRRRLHVAVYAAGLIALKGEQSFITRWDQIEKFWKKVSIGHDGDSSDSYEYKIQRNDGTLYRFKDNLTPAVSHLGRHIEQEVTRLLLPPAIASCAGGAEMTWDGLRVSSSLVSVDGGHRSLSLDEVELVTLDEEHLAIFHKGQQRAWHKQSVEAIANVAVFKGLLDHLLQQRVLSQLPQVIATYHAGTPIAFGRVTLTQQGVEVDQGKKRLFWHEVSTIKVTEEQVDIQSRRDRIWSWQQLARWMVPNAALLKELTASVLQGQQQQMQAYAPAHLQQVLATYHAGMPVTFGPITLSLQGVALDQGRKVLPWSECIGINIAWNFRGGAVLIGKRGKNRAWGVISFADVPDLGLFQALVNHLNRTYTP